MVPKALALENAGHDKERCHAYCEAVGRELGAEPGRDTGCGLCQAVCGDGALSAPRTPAPDDTALAQPVRLPLHRRRCPSCRIDFHQFAAPAEGPHSEERCPTCRQGRPWQPKLVVQDATPS